MKLLKPTIALLAAALTPALAYLIIYSINLPSGFDAIRASIIFGAIAFVVASAHLLILGIPAILIGLHFKAIRWWTTLLVSFLIGATPYALSTWPPVTSLSIDLFGGMGFGLFGLSGGLAFWLLWRYWARPKPLIRSTTVDESFDKSG